MKILYITKKKLVELRHNLKSEEDLYNIYKKMYIT